MLLRQQFGRALMQLWLVVACLWVMGSGHAVAQSTVTGTITGNTTLRAAQSPYRFQGDVVLDNNATLSIEPGVTVQMAPAASFTLKMGALQAVGTPGSPIRITSAASMPAAGDWRQWRFTPGTNNALTQLGYLSIEYGSGVAIEGASPVINSTAINHHSGPAITMDLASSPVGTGNTASGNSVNAIAVPTGTIRSQVVWGVVGIPYLVRQGLVQVGQAPLSLEPGMLKLSPGVVAMLRVSLNAPAPSGGVVIDVTSSVPSVASAVSRVTIAAGEVGADLEIQASTIGSTRVTASNAALGFAETQVEVVNLPSLGLSPSSPTVGLNRAYPMTMSLPSAAGAAGVAVQLGNSNSSVLSAPSSLLVPAGQQSISFEVTGLTDGTARITAQAEGYASALATVIVRSKALVLPSSVIVAPNGQTTVTLEATEPAPASGLAVALALEQAGLAQIPASVQIPAGQSKATFVIQGQSLGTTNLTATAAGYQSAATVLRVDAISLNTDPSADLVMSEELTRTIRVLLNKAAPQGGVTASIGSRDSAIATATPAEVFIPQGQIYATVPVTVKALTVGKTAIDIAAPGLVAKVVNVDVREKFGLKLTRTGGSKLIVGKGLYNYYNELYVQRLINGVVSNGADAVTVNLRCVAEDVCKTPATVTIPAGQSAIHIYVTGVDVGTTQIEATAAGFESAVINAETVSPILRMNNVPVVQNVGQRSPSIYVSAEVPGAYYSTSQYAASPLTVTWTSSVPSVGTVTAITTWGADASNSGYAAFTAVAPGTTQITASTPGFTAATSAPITVNP